MENNYLNFQSASQGHHSPGECDIDQLHQDIVDNGALNWAARLLPWVYLLKEVLYRKVAWRKQINKVNKYVMYDKISPRP